MLGMFSACGAGTAADLQHVTNMLSTNMELLELNMGRKARVVSVLRRAKQHLFRCYGFLMQYCLVSCPNIPS